MKIRFGKNQKLVVEAITMAPSYLQQDELYSLNYIVSYTGLTEKQVLSTVPSLIKKGIFNLCAGEVLEAELSSYRGQQAPEVEAVPEVEEVEQEEKEKAEKQEQEKTAQDVIFDERLKVLMSKLLITKGYIRAAKQVKDGTVPLFLLTGLRKYMDILHKNFGLNSSFFTATRGYNAEELIAAWDSSSNKDADVLGIFRHMLMEDVVADEAYICKYKTFMGFLQMFNFNVANPQMELNHQLYSFFKESAAKYFGIWIGKHDYVKEKEKAEEAMRRQSQEQKQRWQDAFNSAYTHFSSTGYSFCITPEQKLNSFAQKVGYTMTGNQKKDLRRLNMICHPDRVGGNEELMKELNGIKDLLK